MGLLAVYEVIVRWGKKKKKLAPSGILFTQNIKYGMREKQQQPETESARRKTTKLFRVFRVKAPKPESK